MTSIRRWLLRWLILGLIAACIAAGYGIFQTAREEAGELFDYELRTVALSLPKGTINYKAAPSHGYDLQDISDDRIVIDIWDKTGRLLFHSLREPALPPLGIGFHTVRREGSLSSTGITEGWLPLGGLGRSLSRGPTTSTHCHRKAQLL